MSIEAKIVIVRILNSELSFILFFCFYFIFSFILVVFILNLDIRCDVTVIQVTCHMVVTYITVTKSYDTREESRTDNIM